MIIELATLTVGEILERSSLRIPNYQRPYAWAPNNALRLLDDIVEAHRAAHHSGAMTKEYGLGSVILHRLDEGEGMVDHVVDGQQRLLTLTLIDHLLGGEDFSEIEPSANAGPTPLQRVIDALLASISVLPKETGLREYLRDHCLLVAVVTDDADEAFRFFDSQNTRGRALSPHDLLKSFHLRAMQGSPGEQRAVVEVWERASDADLRSLFGEYLYRILRWNRGLTVSTFGVRDLDLFKGLDEGSPAARYHLSAQLTLPVLQAWPNGADDQEDLSLAQIDVPVINGRPFFDRTNRLLSALAKTQRDLFPQVAGDDAAREFSEEFQHGRYRYVASSYVAAVLYWRTRFSDSRGSSQHAGAEGALRSWAYRYRLQRQRVTWRGLDKYVREGAPGDQGDLINPFTVIRDARTGRDVLRLAQDLPDTPQSKTDDELLTLLSASERPR